MLFSIKSVLYLGVSLHSWTAGSERLRPRASHEAVKRELATFEEQYINSLNFKLPNETVKLVGCKKFKVPHDEVDGFESHLDTHRNDLQSFKSHFYDEASMELRIYFPVAGALLEHKGVFIEASDLGEIEVEEVDGDYAVLGRYQTDHVHGVDGNIIKDGVIYLAEKACANRVIGNIFVYDFGYKDLIHHHPDHVHGKRSNPEAPDNGCVKNHGGINCSDKYGIHEGRCPEVKSTCMDYNGYGTDCLKAHKIEYFIGSDCSVSVANGNCWNEMVTAYNSLPWYEKIGFAVAIDALVGEPLLG